MHLHRDTAAVIDDLHPTVAKQGDLDLVRVARHRLIDGVVHNLPHQVVQAAHTCGTDVHTGALTHRLEALKDGDR
ncbi:hypothetical protein GCM10027157_12360 [Corynebacterium aquatimens]